MKRNEKQKVQNQKSSWVFHHQTRQPVVSKTLWPAHLILLSLINFKASSFRLQNTVFYCCCCCFFFSLQGRVDNLTPNQQPGRPAPVSSPLTTRKDCVGTILSYPVTKRVFCMLKGVLISGCKNFNVYFIVWNSIHQ